MPSAGRHGARMPLRRAANAAPSVHVQPAAVKHASPSARARSARTLAASLSESAQAASTALPRLSRSLARFHAMTSAAGCGRERSAAEVGGDAVVEVVDAVGRAAEVEDAGDARRADHDGARVEVRSREHHHDAVHVREEPQRHALVGHAVLQTQDRDVGRCHRGQLLESRRRLMRLRRQQRDVVAVPIDLGGIIDDGHVERHLAFRILEAQAVTRQRLEVGDRGRPAPSSGRAGEAGHPPHLRWHLHRSPRNALAKYLREGT